MADEPQRQSALYCGPDLINAAERSSIRRSVLDRRTGLLNGLGVVADAIRYRRKEKSDRPFEVATASGPIRGTTTTASVAYAGNGVNRDWCLGTALSERTSANTLQFSSANEVLDTLQQIKERVDIVFVEGLGEEIEVATESNFVRMPAWIKQRVRLANDWQSQIRSLKRGTRQEISRLLRKYGYECRLSSNERDMRRFYDEQYQPYISASYGDAAIIVDQDRFIGECRRGVLIQLVSKEAIVATALLRPIGRSMAIVWTGMDRGPGENRAPGATDVLDYFSLLYSHLMGCRWLDFGPSRPDLYDGTLRYKSKWGAEIYRGLFAQPSIAWTCNNDSQASRDFLTRHVFVSNDNRTLSGLAFLETDSAKEQRSTIERLISPGIDDYRVVALSPMLASAKADIESIHKKITVSEANSVSDAMQIASRVS